MAAYYNENDKYAAQWLRNLIDAGMIAPGDVDDRSILDVSADDLKGYTQHHFFAGLGGWSYALRLAGWPDDKPAWTGSPPCQPFSVAGKQLGKDDERHLAPVWLRLTKQIRPQYIFGEQVDAAIRHGWLDDLQDALEAEGYSTGAVVLPACSVSEPHIRQRLWFVASRMGNAIEQGLEGHSGNVEHRKEPGRQQANQARPVAEASGADRVANTNIDRCNQTRECESKAGSNGTVRDAGISQGQSATGKIDSFWSDCDWLLCRDDQWRPVEPGLAPMVDWSTARVERIRAYGNAIVPQVAAEVIKAFLETA